MDHASTKTAPTSAENEAKLGAGEPGLAMVFSGRALAIPIPIGARVGREQLAGLGVIDDEISRQHFSLGRHDGMLTVTDDGSRNGTFVDGRRVSARTPVAFGAVVKAGRTLFVAVPDASAFERYPTTIDDTVVMGPATRELYSRASALGKLGQLLVCGESGVGKELVARAFHAELGSRAPFVALNCATIQSGIAERLLFGVKKGAYTGAEADAEGHVQAAEGGTLFLDEIGDLDIAVQAKLLRFLETHQYFPLGDTRPKTARVRVCFATLHDLHREVAARRFREDLYHRIVTPALSLPALRERREEIPFFLELSARRSARPVALTTAFVERALMTRWPGNVRQLLRCADAAFVSAEVAGRAALTADDVPMDRESSESDREGRSASADLDAGSARAHGGGEGTADPSDAEIVEAMRAAGNNVSVAARALGVHRSKLRRRLAKSSGFSG